MHTISESYVSEGCKSLRKVGEIYAGRQQKCLRSEFSKGMIAVLNTVIAQSICRSLAHFITHHKKMLISHC